MPKLKHQAIVQILHDEPQLVAMLLGHSGLMTPSGSYPVIADRDLSHRSPDLLKELREDNVCVHSRGWHPGAPLSCFEALVSS
jgi:hypothetical protein